MNTLNIDAEVTLKSLNMLIEKIGYMFIWAGDKMVDCREHGRWKCSAAPRLAGGLFCSRFAPSSVYNSICLPLCISISSGSLQYVSLCAAVNSFLHLQVTFFLTTYCLVCGFWIFLSSVSDIRISP